MSDMNESFISDGGTVDKTTIEILELIYLSQVAVLTLFGNCLVLLAFVFAARSIRTYTNYFVVNLAVSDLMVGCISLPFWIVFRTGWFVILIFSVYALAVLSHEIWLIITAD